VTYPIANTSSCGRVVVGWCFADWLPQAGFEVQPEARSNAVSVSLLDVEAIAYYLQRLAKDALNACKPSMIRSKQR